MESGCFEIHGFSLLKLTNLNKYLSLANEPTFGCPTHRGFRKKVKGIFFQRHRTLMIGKCFIYINSKLSYSYAIQCF